MKMKMKMKMKIKSIVAFGVGVLCSLQVHAEESTNLSPNAGFEISSIANGSFQYSNHEGFMVPNWVFEKGAGIANHSGVWGGEAINNSLAFLQSDAATVSQIVTSRAQHFKITLDTAQRDSNIDGSLDVYWDNKLLGSITPETIMFEHHEFITSGLPTLIHTLTFRQTVEGDVSVFIDNVSIISNPVSQPVPQI